MAFARAGELTDALESILQDTGLQKSDLDDARLLFSASLLRDIMRAGGRVWVRDSRLFVTWPDWNGPEGRRNARAAMVAARELRPLKATELKRVEPLFSPDISGDQLSQILAEATFELTSASTVHPTGIPYTEAFSAALRYWTMPYRGRTGRMRRFVLTATHRHLGTYHIPMRWAPLSPGSWTRAVGR
jgi:hypothetical protein